MKGLRHKVGIVARGRHRTATAPRSSGNRVTQMQD